MARRRPYISLGDWSQERTTEVWLSQESDVVQSLLVGHAALREDLMGSSLLGAIVGTSNLVNRVCRMLTLQWAGHEGILSCFRVGINL